ncbi:Uncharacterized conserved protein YlxW, UPF0749 family [Alteribacillus persepolensis]|uniref:Uncharacterized conserved protein YlxW, UPF0749 family n=1 Tax=Alteribacillus persepolensis TaxID=568899 RepID=A0A1G7YFX5_9BACI|nr:DUF881 domain-containing protein [Alteribacillus persepolensis]SDG95246.1 Uncharacterized conserved protein YlxW, UPF0749 family [Alteribacillus persepolensis]
MKKQQKVFIAGLCAAAGFLVINNIDFSSESSARENKDIVELRKTLEEEQEHRQKLYEHIREQEQLLERYKTEQKNSREEAMEEAVANLEEKAGLTKRRGEGVTIQLTADTKVEETADNFIGPEVLRKLVNELYRFGAKDISIEGERILETSAFRDIDGEVHINGQPLSGFPITIKALTDDPKAVHNQFMVSDSWEYLTYEQIAIESSIEQELVIPAYEEVRRVRFMEAAEED